MMNCDIVLTVYNNLELTKKCLDSLLCNWRKSDGLIIVDNASQSETANFIIAFKFGGEFNKLRI